MAFHKEIRTKLNYLFLELLHSIEVNGECINYLNKHSSEIFLKLSNEIEAQIKDKVSTNQDEIINLLKRKILFLYHDNKDKFERRFNCTSLYQRIGEGIANTFIVNITHYFESIPFKYLVSIRFPFISNEFFADKKIHGSSYFKSSAEYLTFQIACEGLIESISSITWQNAFSNVKTFIFLGLCFDLLKINLDISSKVQSLLKDETASYMDAHVSFVNLPSERKIEIPLSRGASAILYQLELTEECIQNTAILEERFNLVSKYMAV